MLSSPPRLLPPISPARRPPSPTMSPGGRRGRGLGTTDESHLRDLSPNTTLRAFTQRPMPYDTGRDEYKIFACIEMLTPAERELGARVAKAAQRLKGWCEEIEQWGWSGSFEQPSEEYRERRRRSLELRIKEHDREGTLADKLPPLEYWGSLLSVEVESHDARLDEIGDELIALDVEELKGHVMDMHPSSRSRPSSAGYDASRDSYKPLDDFNFLITQTLLSALPHHFQLKDRLSTWTARVTILREAPRYLADLKFAKKLMRMGWEALEPPKSASDSAFSQWKDTVGTASEAMRDRVGDLGRRLDRMLDTLEGRDDCLPDNWIDIFEGVEADYGRWTHESRKRMIDFDVRRYLEYNAANGRGGTPEALDNPTVTARAYEGPKGRLEELHEELSEESPQEPVEELLESIFKEEHKQPLGADSEVKQAPIHRIEMAEPRSITALEPNLSQIPGENQGIASNESPQPVEPESPAEESFFEEGDTVVHNEIDYSPSDSLQAGAGFDGYKESPIIITTEDQDDTTTRRPETPRSRRASIDSLASDISYSSSLPGVAEESPSVRNTTNRAIKAPRPALNAAMTKRRPARKSNELSIDSTAPWPPTQFAHKTPTSADDLDRKISDILDTLPAHIRLTSNSRASARDLRSPRVTSKGSKGNIRAKPSLNGMKSPELTLSPAKPDFESANAASGRKSIAALRADADNGIKVYHLTQPGKEHPIKLFIRRVGENGERVMVRVGGGWADLGEYLRQYAEHHGRRTVSSEKFEILGLEVGNNELSPGRPESAMSKRDRRFSGGYQASSPSTTPVKAAGTGLSKNEAPPPMPNFTPTPAGSGETSAPSTGSSRQSWQGNEVGLAGPKSKKLDLSNEKLEWIEGMMKQARTVSGNISQTPNQHNERGESRSESRSESRTSARKKTDFGDLGKVGGTKRIFMRGGALHEH